MSCSRNLRGWVFLASLAACGPSAVGAEAGIEAPVPTPGRFIEYVMNNDPARFDKLVPDRIHPNAEGAREIIMPTLIKELGL